MNLTPRVTGRRGSILVLVAVVIVALLGLAALVIDIGVALDAKHELKDASQSAALGALSAYLEHLKSEGDDYVGAAQAAKTRAGEILRSSRLVLRGFLKNQTDLGDLALIDPQGENNEARDGSIEVGFYHWAQPSGADQDPCNGEYPCFEGASTSARTNSVRLTLTLKAETALRTIFGGVLGISDIDLTEHSVATFIPRNDAFLVDLSASTGADNHKIFGQRKLPEDSAACNTPPLSMDPSCFYSGSRAFFAYNLPEYDPFTGGCGNGAVYGPSCNTAYIADRIAANGALYGDLWSQACDTRPVSGTCVAETADFTGTSWHDNDDAKVHPRDDYRVRSVTLGYNPITGATASTEWMLVDYGENRSALRSCADGTIGGPCTDVSPLQAILLAVHRGMELLKDRAVASDGFFFSGFDQDIWETRMTCDAAFGSCDESTPKFVAPTSPTFKGMLDATDLVGNPDGYVDRALITTAKNTDLMMSIWYAYLEMRQQPTFAVAKNSIWIFTDGGANCCDDGNGAGCAPAFAPRSNTVNEWVTSKRACRTDDRHIYSALLQISRSNLHASEIANILLVELVHNRVSINVVLVGEQVRPHQVVRRKPDYLETGGHPEGCLDLQEALIYGEGFVAWGEDLDPNERSQAFQATLRGEPGAFYPIPNRLYMDLVLPTRGAWIPIYPALTNEVTGAPVNFSELMKTCCNNEAAAGGLVTLYDSCIANDGSADGKSIVDEMGRLLYDPYGRSTLEQMEEAMERYLESPYTLVEAE